MTDEITTQLETMSESSALAALQLLDPLLIVERSGDPSTDGTKYSIVAHSELCRFKMLGMTDANAARALGIAPKTLMAWGERFPQLRRDLQQAAQLATAHVTGMLFGLMSDSGPVALNAIKFWLSSRTDEFKEKAELAITTAAGVGEIENAIRHVYGVELEPKSSGDADDVGSANNYAPQLPAPSDS